MAKENMEWIPKTKLGKLVISGKITTLSQALSSYLPLKEPQIVDLLMPGLEEEVLDVKMVQRMTDSGRRTNFAVTVVVGNKNGFVGIGRARGKEVGPTIKRAIQNAKLKIIEIKRGCGSWECGCNTSHSLPFKVVGSAGSVRVVLKPAPRGVGLAVGNVSKAVLRLAGISDVWGFTQGHTKTTVNYAFATYDALKATAIMRISSRLSVSLPIFKGGVNDVHSDTSEGTD
ncbi:MAG: 30S ribosomal protein S5 [Thermoplasmata archaeon]